MCVLAFLLVPIISLSKMEKKQVEICQHFLHINVPFQLYIGIL